MPITPPLDRYRERSSRNSAIWTPAQMRAAYAAAEAGSLMRLADLVDATLEDDRVAGTSGTRTRGLLGLPLTFAATDPDEAPDTALLKALERDFWRALPESALSELMSWGLLLGVGLGELRWEPRGGRVIPRLRVWHPRWLRFDQASEAWILSTDNAGEIPIDPADPAWILYTPYGPDRPWRRAAVRPIGLYWLLKRYALQDWGTYGEAHGNPTRVATAPTGASKEDRQAIAADLQDISGRTGMSLPDGFTVQLLEATARTWETFRGQIDVANAGIAVTILGQTLTTEVKGGSLAAARVHDTVRHDLIESDAQVLTTSLHDGPIASWARFNFGLEAERAPWPTWDTEPPSDAQLVAGTRRARAEALTALAAAIEAWRRLGAPLDLERLSVEHEVPLADLQAAVAHLSAPLPDEPGEGDLQFVQRVRDAGELARALAAAQPPTRLTAAERRVQLASGSDPRDSAGFVRGQLYVDGLKHRLDRLQPMQAAFDKISAFITAADSFEQIQEGLPGLLEQLDPDDVGPLMEALMLADLAGQLAATTDL